MAKRGSYNWLQESGDHWLTVSTMSNNVLQSTKVPAGSDLKRALISAIAGWADDGWDVKSFSSSSSEFFCNKSGERGYVVISPTNPGHVAPTYRPR